MKMGLVGFPATGKTTLFNILTDSRAETSRFGSSGKADPHVGVARVPDRRLDELSALFSPKKTTPATIEYVDLAGFRKGESDTGLALTELRNADALLHVVRAFEDELNPHSEGSVDPARDIDTMETALLLSDHAVAEKRIARLRLAIQKTNRGEEKQELELLEKVMGSLEAEQPVRQMELSAAEELQLKGFAFLSARPILHVINLGEDQIEHVADFRSHYKLDAVTARMKTGLVPLSARIEQEITELSATDAIAFQADLGLDESCRPRVIQASYDLLGLISFFTVGEDECRAWSIPGASAARKAAGVIHTDIEKGFIRAEVIPVPDLLNQKTLPAAREKGLLRLEGKDYIVQDGDVINFRFNV